MKQVKKNKFILIIALILSALIWGCEEEPQVERSKLVKVFVEITVAQNKYSNYPDSLQIAKQQIFDKYEITPELYKTSIENAEIRAEYWDAFFKEAKEYLDSLKLASRQNSP